jgi:hypothetical protein
MMCLWVFDCALLDKLWSRKSTTKCHDAHAVRHRKPADTVITVSKRPPALFSYTVITSTTDLG